MQEQLKVDFTCQPICAYKTPEVHFHISFLLRLCVTPQLSINAFDYNCHVDLIKLLKQEGELFRLRKARQKMSELFPLTEGRCTANMLLGLEE